MSLIRNRNQLRVFFLGLTYAGHRTRFSNLRSHVEQSSRVSTCFREVTGWKEGGLLERLPLVPQNMKAYLRGYIEAAPVARIPRVDIIWTSATEAIVPYLWLQLW